MLHTIIIEEDKTYGIFLECNCDFCDPTRFDYDFYKTDGWICWNCGNKISPQKRICHVDMNKFKSIFGEYTSPATSCTGFRWLDGFLQ